MGPSAGSYRDEGLGSDLGSRDLPHRILHLAVGVGDEGAAAGEEAAVAALAVLAALHLLLELLERGVPG